MGTVFWTGTSEYATLTNTFSVDGTATDPTTVSLTVGTPSGTSTTSTYADAEITRSSTGVYTMDVSCTEAGIWTYVWTGTGTASDVQVGTWTVLSADLTARYCTIEELKSRLGGITSTADDLEFELAIAAVCRAIDEYCCREFWYNSTTRTFEVFDEYLLDVDDLSSITTLKTDASGDGTFETTWSASDYQLLPVNATTGAESCPYTRIKAIGSYTFPTRRSRSARNDRVQIVGTFGWPAVPAAVKQAALILSADYYRLKDAPFGVAAMGDYGVRIRDNSRAMLLLGPYRLHAAHVG